MATPCEWSCPAPTTHSFITIIHRNPIDMMTSRLLLVVAILACVASASSAHVLYTRTTAPLDWEQGGRAPSDHSTLFTIALRQRNLDVLEKWFWEASDSTHPNYQSFRSIDEIHSLISPESSEKTSVIEWLHSAGVHDHEIRDLGDALDVQTSVAQAERLFDTEMYEFTHMTGVKIIRSMGSYSVPHHLKHLVEMVTGLSTFPIPHLNVRHMNARNDYGVVPQTCEALYQIAPARRLVRNSPFAAATSQGVIEFQGQSYAPSDLDSFGKGCKIAIDALPQDQIVGPNNPSSPQVEASLDIEMMATVNAEAAGSSASKADNWFWLEQGNGWLYQFATHFFNTQSVPQVNSISYGWWEGDQCAIAEEECSQLGVDSTGYVKRVNTEFQKIGLRGISLISASGDSGANGRTNPTCYYKQLRPAFPASSPYITAVGATELTNVQPLTNPPPICSSSGYPCVVSGEEQAVSFEVSGFASGGGFSNIAPMPEYQAPAVKDYLTSGVELPPEGYFNRSGRAFPDVSAIGHNLLIVDRGSSMPVGGTSASAPIFGAIISLLNTLSMERSGKPLGFLNPLLYRMSAEQPNAFHDIVVGDNICTEQGCQPQCKGFKCTKGWDPVTGLGTPNTANMAAYIKNKLNFKN